MYLVSSCYEGNSEADGSGDDARINIPSGGTADKSPIADTGDAAVVAGVVAQCAVAEVASDARKNKDDQSDETEVLDCQPTEAWEAGRDGGVLVT